MVEKRGRVRGTVSVVYPNNSKEENARCLKNIEDVLNRCLRKIGMARVTLTDTKKYSETGVLER